MEDTTVEPVFGEDPTVLLDEHRGQYLLINAIARRVRQLQIGDRPRAYPADLPADHTKIATQEFLEGKLDIYKKMHHDKFAMEMDHSLD